jgi:RNA polymerase-binding transcription factor DksA
MTATEPMSSDPGAGASMTTQPTNHETSSAETTSTDTNVVVSAATPSPSAERGTTEQVPSDEHAEAVQLRVELDDVESALDRLDAGTYGTCEICGTELPDADLERHPQTRLCAAHSA